MPPLPDDAREVIERGVQELRLQLDDDQREAVEGHLRLLLAWNGSVNLTAIRDPLAAARLHVLDSLAAVPLLRDLRVDRLLDLGSGGGYPGLPLAAVVPASAVLVDSVGKKIRFLEAAISATGLDSRVAAISARAESLAADPAHRAARPLVTARAVAALPDLVELAMPLLELGGSLVAWKRGAIDDELAAGARAAAALGAEPPAVHPVDLTGLAGHVLIRVVKRRPTPTGFPREPAVRVRRPW